MLFRSEEDEIPSVSAPVSKAPTVTPSEAHAQPIPSTTITQSPASGQNLAEEKNRSLNLLQSLFGDADDWGGAESVDSDVDIEDANNDAVPTTEDQVPIAASVADPSAVAEIKETPAEIITPTPESATQGAGAVQKTKLKDLFAPREEEGMCCPHLTHLQDANYLSPSWLLPPWPSRLGPGTRGRPAVRRVRSPGDRRVSSTTGPDPTLGSSRISCKHARRFAAILLPHRLRRW